MILLTFVKNSNGSHGTVGRTTGFGNGRYKFESQPLPTVFNLSITTENRDTAPLPLLCMISFDTRTFLKPGRVFLRNFSVLWDQTISTKNHDTHPLYYPSHFSTPEISETLKGFPTKVSALWDKKFSCENLDAPYPPPPLIH